MPDIKFCGLAREQDAAFVAAVGAEYAGVIFAGGPREQTPERATGIFAAAGADVHRVGVFGSDFRERIPSVVSQVSLDVIQLHADPTIADVRDARRIFDGMVWAGVRVGDHGIPSSIAGLFGEADAVLLDALAAGALGGTGTRLPWPALAEDLAKARAGAMLVLAGGLLPENVGDAIAALEPDVVDVSSGVESSPGIKDHEKMTAFAYAARRSEG